jgi:trans-AT polyketide synthase/acyltransferase/oxidoreductase domain-containing protein
VDQSLAPEDLGDPAFRRTHGARLAYVAGGMYKAIASEALVMRMARARMLAYFGTAGLALEPAEAAIARLATELPDLPWGVNLVHDFIWPEREQRLVDVLLRHRIRRIEAAAFIDITPALVRYRLSGATRDPDGTPRTPNHVLAKVSRLEVATAFLSPPAAPIVKQLLDSGQITPAEAELAPHIAIADDVCAEADSGGHTDKQVAWALLPGVLRLRDSVAPHVRVGCAGGLGTPEAIVAAFLLGADFVLTGSINQCTPEAGTSDLVKELLAGTDIHDFEMAPAGDMFEIGARVQVLRRGVLFPARANRLHEIYRAHAGLLEIPAATLREIEEKYFGRSCQDVWAETRRHYDAIDPGECDEAERTPKKKMAMIFRWWFVHTARLAMEGRAEHRAQFQVHSGPAMGALNRWLRGSALEDWRKRHVDALGELLMEEAARHLRQRYRALTRAA